jgi:hypothetical protein
MNAGNPPNAPKDSARVHGHSELFGVTHVLWCVVAAVFMMRLWWPLVPTSWEHAAGLFFAWPLAVIMYVGMLWAVAYLVRVRDSADRPLRPTEWIPRWAAVLSVSSYVYWVLFAVGVDNHRGPSPRNEFIVLSLLMAIVSFPVARHASWRFLLIGVTTLVFPYLLSGFRSRYGYPG